MDHADIVVAFGELGSEQLSCLGIVAVPGHALLESIERQLHILVELEIEESKIEVRLNVTGVDRQGLLV